MKTIIVPIDFSDVSLNALDYTMSLTGELGETRIVLYRSTIGTAKNLTNDASAVISEAKEELVALIEKLNEIAPHIEFIAEVNDDSVFENIVKLYAQYNASLIAMGITGKNKLEQKVIGSNTIRIVLKSGFPVLIVPVAATYKPVEKVALALQFKENILEKIPSKDIIDFAQSLDAQLMVLNIEKEGDNTPASLVYAGQQAAHLMFEKANATFHLVADNDVVGAITDFCADANADIVISIAEEHGFFESLFKGSVTKSLAFYSSIPLLVFKANT